jgi:hypothetical protein
MLNIKDYISALNKHRKKTSAYVTRRRYQEVMDKYMVLKDAITSSPNLLTQPAAVTWVKPYVPQAKELCVFVSFAKKPMVKSYVAWHIQAFIDEGIDVLLAIDWQGALQIKRHFPQSVSVFILPPSLETLKHRLTERQQDHTEIINFRMQQAREEMTHYTEFDYLIINEEFAKAATELQAIIIANRLQTARQSQTERKLLSFLLSSQ